MKVITYETPRGEQINLCRECAEKETPRNRWGEEYCQVSRGGHSGACDRCEDVQEARND